MNKLQAVFGAIRSFWELITYVISGIRVVDILDIIVITFVIYKFIIFFRQTRGGQLIKGLIILLFVALVAQWLNMVMVKWATTKVMDSLLIAAVIIFQPEIRRALERVGNSKFSSFGISGDSDLKNNIMEKQIESVSRAAGLMQEQKCGALIVFERNTQLGEIISTGTVIDAASSAQLICNIFYPKSPLHDGGMILRGGSIYAAGCILPLTQNGGLSKSLGTRHRAAVGMSENSDAVVVVVSEETGVISVVVNGEIKRGFDAITLRTELNSLLINEKSEESGGVFSRILRSVKSKFQKSGKNK